MLDLQLIYQYGTTIVLVFALIILVSLFYFTAPYGRHQRSRNAGLNPRIGWVIMELPSVVLFALVYFHGVNANYKASFILFSVWELHYIQRTFIYPALMRPGVAMMPYSIIATGGFFNIINALLNAIALTHLPFGYPDSWLIDLRFLLGISLFFLGFMINIHSDHILRNLRKPREIDYKIPRGGLFRWISSPNYFGEIMEWCGCGIATWSLAGVAFAAFTFANLAPRAWSHHKWYNKTFSNYPKNRKAIIPFIF